MTPQASPLLDWSPDAVVFDCDGTLMDTERHWQDARTRALRAFGLRPSPGFAERAKGVHYTDCGRLMAEEAHKPELTDELTRALLEHFLELVANDPVTMPGAVEFVRSLSGRLPLAVASNCPLEVVEESLSRARLLRHFQHIVVPSGMPPDAPGTEPGASGADPGTPGADPGTPGAG
ncbi:HAD family hydrolase, partial [Streptomyces sp. NPDC004752]